MRAQRQKQVCGQRLSEVGRSVETDTHVERGLQDNVQETPRQRTSCALNTPGRDIQTAHDVTCALGVG